MLSESGGGIGRIAASVLLVSAGVAAALRLVDAIPSLVLGEGRGIRRFDSVEAGVGALGAGVLVPRYFPDTLRWPPSSVRVGRSPEAGIGIHFKDRGGEHERLFIFETRPGGDAFPRGLVPEVRPFYTARVALGQGEGTFRSVRSESGTTLSEVEFRQAGRRILVRLDGPGDELMRIAESLREKR